MRVQQCYENVQYLEQHEYMYTVFISNAAEMSNLTAADQPFQIQFHFNLIVIHFVITVTTFAIPNSS